MRRAAAGSAALMVALFSVAIALVSTAVVCQAAPHLPVVLDLASSAAAGPPGATFYVSPFGNDSWSGTLPSPAPSGEDGPFLTVAAAQSAARHSGDGPDGDALPRPVRVYLRALPQASHGTLAPASYHLPATLAFDARDSYTTYSTYPPDVGTGVTPTLATLSGGVALSGWAESPDATFARAKGPSQAAPIEAPLPLGFNASGYRCRQLWVGGERRTLARMPNAPLGLQSQYSRGLSADGATLTLKPIAPCSGGSCPAVDRLGLVYSGNDLSPDWYDLNAVSVLVFHAWTASHHSVGRVLPGNHTLLFAQPSMWPIGEYSAQGGHRYIVQNVREGLDAPGEFYCDAPRRRMMYVPASQAEREGLLSGAVQAVVPALDTVVDVSGGARGLTLSQLAVAHADTGHTVGAYFPPVGAVMVQNASDLRVDRCRVGNAGGTGIMLGAGVNGASVSNSAVVDCGGEGIAMTAADATDVAINATLVNDTAYVFMSQPASIRVRGARNVSVSHCDAGHNAYGGILVGWQPGSRTPPVPPVPQPLPPFAEAPTFHIAHNDVHDFGLGILSDFGGIYLSSDDNVCYTKGTCFLPALVERNHVRRGTHYNYGSNGIYTDEQFAGLVATQNVFGPDIGGAAVYMHCGTWHNVSNNVLAGVTTQGRTGGYLASCNRGGNPTWPNITHGFSFTRNIVFISGASQGNFTQDSDYRDTTFDRNVYFNAQSVRQPLQFPNHTTFAQWQTGQGQDLHSVVGHDPLFLSPGDPGDWRVRTESPALARGFVPWDASPGGVGCGGGGNPWC